MNISNYSTKFYSGDKAISDYLSDIRKYTVPTTEEEVALFERIAKGDDNARSEIIVRNQRFVYALAKIYSNNEDNVLDYVNEGNIGLITAINTFDLSKNVKFITHAVWSIRRSMNYYLSTTNNLIVKSNSMKLGKKVDTVRQAFIGKHGFAPTNDQIISLIKEKYGIDIKDASDVYDLSVSSINAEIDDDYTMENSSEYNNRTSSSNGFDDESERVYNEALIKSILSRLDAKKQDIIKMSFGLGYERPYTAKEIGEKHSMDEATVNQLKNNIILYLKQNKGGLKIAI